MHRIDIFFAYQFNSVTISRIDRDAAIGKGVQAVETELQQTHSPLELKWKIVDLDSGDFLKTQIEDLILNSGIFVADISENNPNVMFELGMAYALSRMQELPIVLLCHKDKDISDIPSDLSGVYVEKYESEYFQVILQKELKKACIRFIQSTELIRSRQLTKLGFWGLQAGTDVDIVCSEIPEDELPEYADPHDRDYLRYARFADLDSLIHIKTHLASIFPMIRFRDFTASEHKSTEYKSLIVIGGPAWNKRFKILQESLPVQFVDLPEEIDDILVFREGYECSDVKLRPIESEGGKIDRDVSLVCRMTDVSGRTQFLFGGSLTHGVLGACKGFLSMNVGVKNVEYVEDAVGRDDFLVIYYSNYIEHEVMCPSFEIDEPLALFRRQRNSGSQFTLLRSRLPHGRG